MKMAISILEVFVGLIPVYLSFTAFDFGFVFLFYSVFVIFNCGFVLKEFFFCKNSQQHGVKLGSPELIFF